MFIKAIWLTNLQKFFHNGAEYKIFCTFVLHQSEYTFELPPALINSHHQDDSLFLVGRGCGGPYILPPSHPPTVTTGSYGFRTDFVHRKCGKKCFKKPNHAAEIESFAWNLLKHWHQRIKRQLMFFFCIPTLHWHSVLQFDVYFWNNQDRMERKIEKEQQKGSKIDFHQITQLPYTSWN